MILVPLHRAAFALWLTSMTAKAATINLVKLDDRAASDSLEEQYRSCSQVCMSGPRGSLTKLLFLATSNPPCQLAAQLGALGKPEPHRGIMDL